MEVRGRGIRKGGGKQKARKRWRNTEDEEEVEVKVRGKVRSSGGGKQNTMKRWRKDKEDDEEKVVELNRR